VRLSFKPFGKLAMPSAELDEAWISSNPGQTHAIIAYPCKDSITWKHPLAFSTTIQDEGVSHDQDHSIIF